MSALKRAFLVLTLLCALSDGARAGGFSIPDIGTRRTGMYAVMGKPDDGSAIFHNPAGMTLQKGTRLYYFQLLFLMDLGLRLYDSEGVLRPEGRNVTPDFNFGGLPFLGVQSDFGTEKLRGGIAIYAPNAFATLLPKREPTRYHATRVLLLSTRATGSVAWEVNRWLSVGASAHLIFTYMTASRVMNPVVLASPDRRFDPRSESAPFDHDLTIDGKGVTWGWDIGLLFTPTPTFRIGLSFSSGAMTTLSGDVRLKGPDGALVTKTTQTTDMPVPFTLRAGFNWEFAPNFELGMDVFYWHYQVFQEQRSRFKAPIMGISEFRDPKNFGNSWNWCIGLLYRVIPPLELMVGFQMDFTPIPASTYSLDNPTTSHVGVSFGARWQVTERVGLGVSFFRHWLDLIDVRESHSVPPSNIKGHAAVTSFGLDVNWLL